MGLSFLTSSSKGQTRVTSTLSQSLIVETRWGTGLWDSDMTGQAMAASYLHGSESGLLCGIGSCAKLVWSDGLGQAWGQVGRPGL